MVGTRSARRVLQASLLGFAVTLASPGVSVAAGATPAAPSMAEAKPRLIVITDIGTEPDDMESMVRLLTYANDIDIEGLIAATSRHLRHEVGRHLIEERVQAYGEVLRNLRVHDKAYPDAAALMSRVRSTPAAYGMAGLGEGKDNEASRLIVEAVDRDDPRPVWVSIWGGAQPLAQALWTVRATRTPAEVERFVSKLRVYSISDQDDTGPWARAAFPKLFWIASVHGPTQYELGAWTGISSPTAVGADPSLVSRRWIDQNVRSKGPLGSVYTAPIFAMEGDTPSFLNLIPNGLSSPEHPDWGGWGGRFGQLAAGLGLWSDMIDTVRGIDGMPVASNKATVWRWRPAFQNDFAARMSWSVTPRYKDANHAPRPMLNGRSGLEPVEITACPGAAVDLRAVGSADPDGQALAYRWWWYREVSGIFSPELTLSASEGPTTTAKLPVWTQPFKIILPDFYQMHVMLEVADNGSPALTRYRRAIIRIPTAGGTDDAGRACARVEQAPAPPLQRITRQVVRLSDAKFNTGETRLGELIDEPAARAILDKHMPGVATRAAATPQGRGMTLEGLSHFDPRLTPQVLEQIDADLAKLPQ